LLRALFSEYFSENGGVAGVFNLKVGSIANVIKKCFEAGVAIALGGLIVAFGESGQKGKYLIRGDGLQISFAKFIVESGKQKFIVFYCIFFSN
jgi:hypothetical protein